MLISDQRRLRFVKNPICTAIQVLISLAISTTVLYANTLGKNDPLNRTVRYLDPSIWSITVKQNECFLAAPRSLLLVEPVTTDTGFREYKISQFFDIAREKELYAQSIDEQIKNRKIVGREFCNGIVSISNMDLPFIKGDSFQDANDGLVVVEKIQHEIINIKSLLQEMTALAVDASSDVYSSSQLSYLDLQFKARINEIEQIAQTTTINGYSIFNGSMTLLTIPNNMSVITIPVENLTTGSAGMLIDDLSLYSNVSALSSLNRLSSMNIPDAALAELKTASNTLEDAAKENADYTMVDVSTDAFSVQHQKGSLALSKTKLHS